MSVIIAIDPGQAGGVAILDGDKLTVHPTPPTARDLCDILEPLTADGPIQRPDVRAYVERVGGYIGPSFDREGMQGGQPASAAFNFGANYGTILGILTALKIPFELVSPQSWQRSLGFGSKGLLRPVKTPTMSKEEWKAEVKRVNSINGKLKTAWKAKLRAVSQQLFPYVKVTLKTADALLILEYARRREKGQPPPALQNPTGIVIPVPTAPFPDKQLCLDAMGTDGRKVTTSTLKS